MEGHAAVEEHGPRHLGVVDRADVVAVLGRHPEGAGRGAEPLAAVRDGHRSVGHAAVLQEPRAVGRQVDAGAHRGRAGGRGRVRRPGRGRALGGVEVGDAVVGAGDGAALGVLGVVGNGPGTAGAAVRGSAPAARPGVVGRSGSGDGRAGNAGCASPTRSGRSSSGRPPSARTAAGRAPGALPSTSPASSPPAATSATTPSPHPARTCRPPRSPHPGTSPSGPRHRRASAAHRRPASIATGSCGHGTRPGTARGCQGRSGGSAASCSSVRSKSTEEYSRSFVSRWYPSIIRTVPDLDRITIDCVVQPPAR